MEILDKIVKKKEQIREFAVLANDNKWISAEVLEKILNDLQKDKITIGIVGQMKHGKSTLLNALIFGDKVLPTATTPMTASLSIITHGETESIEVEFFAVEEWNKLKEKAKSHEKSSEVDSAIELVNASEQLATEIYDLIGTKKEISFDEINEYVGAKGRYTPITKSLRIKHPNFKLKGADFVDTPGFNDPVISRELRTKEFLSKADVVIIVLTANRAFDAQDKDIIFNQIRAVGTGRVVLLINKYDLALEDGEGSPEEILTDVTKKIKHEINGLEKNDPIPAKILSEVTPMLFSSLFALIGKLPPDKLELYKDVKPYYDKYRADYHQIQTQDDFLNWSKLPDLEKEVENIINKDKLNVIIKKPASELIGKIKEYKKELEERAIRIHTEEKGLSKDATSISTEIEELDKLGTEVDNLMNVVMGELKDIIHTNLVGIPMEFQEKISDILRYDLQNLPEKGSFEGNDSYSQRCKIEIENKLFGFRDLFLKKLNDTKSHLFRLFKNEINEIDVNLQKLIGKHVKSEHSIELVKLKQSFLESLNFESRSVEINLDLSEVKEKGYLFIFGISKLDIIENSRKEIQKNFNIKVFNDSTERIKQSFYSNLEYFGKAKQKIVNPIESALKEAKYNIKIKELRLEELKAEKIKINEEINELENNILKIEKELYAQMIL